MLLHDSALPKIFHKRKQVRNIDNDVPMSGPRTQELVSGDVALSLEEQSKDNLTTEQVTLSFEHCHCHALLTI